MFKPQVTPIGAVNGVNKTFTLPSIIALLDVVEVDGATYLGNVNPLNGSDTITLDDAPQYTIQVWYWDTTLVPVNNHGFTLSDLEIKLNFALGTSETNLLTREKRVDAINRVIQTILEQYPIPQYVVTNDLTFYQGVTGLPGDCVQALKLADPKNPATEYSRVSWDSFSLNRPQTYTIAWDSNIQQETIKIYPSWNNVSLRFWYVQNQPLLVNDTDSPRFNVWWQDAIAEKAAEYLLISSASFNRAEAKKGVADDLIAKAWQIERSRITGVQDQRLTSIYSKYSLLS